MGWVHIANWTAIWWWVSHSQAPLLTIKVVWSLRMRIVGGATILHKPWDEVHLRTHLTAAVRGYLCTGWSPWNTSMQCLCVHSNRRLHYMLCSINFV